nr:MAG TPA: hypothetical protein [Caudoviricetes sp.]
MAYVEDSNFSCKMIVLLKQHAVKMTRSQYHLSPVFEHPQCLY